MVIAPLDEVSVPARMDGAAQHHPGGEVYIEVEVLALYGAEAGEVPRANQHADLERMVHRILGVSLATSTLLMVAGVALGLGLHRELPEVVPALGELSVRIAALRPSGFLALGLLVLIVTPILRVVGSSVAFIVEHDWRYAAIRMAVLLVVLTGLLLGKKG